MNRPTLLIVLFLALACPLVAQEPAPAQLTLRDIAATGEPVELTRAWRFHAGDDPRWSGPAVDDRSWEVVDPQMPEVARPKGGWPGAGWFRRHIIVMDQSSPVRVRLSVEGRGHASVFLDGVRLIDDAPAATAKPMLSGAWTDVTLSGGAHVLAVRYACDCAAESGALGFTVAIRVVEGGGSGASSRRARTLLLGAFLGIPLVLGALHLALFLFYRKARENLFCGLCILSLAGIVGLSLAGGSPVGPVGELVLAASMYAAIAGATFFGLMMFAVIRLDRVPSTWIPFAIAGVLLPVVGPFLGRTSGTMAWGLYFLASLVEMGRMSRKGSVAGRESAAPLLIGMLLLDAAIVAQIVINLGLMPAPFGFQEVYVAGVLAFSFAASLFVARSFAGTSIHLERRLAEVEALTAQVIATERESARRGMEIEAARTLQRSILPAAVPEVAQLDIAARITTASEVGGDYYDFRPGSDGSVTIAIGDAAGHGVAAGAMVTATKALFSSMATEESLPAILSRCDQVLRTMNVRPLYMCLLLARVSGRSMSVASAAMPRPLHFHRATESVDEVMVGGLPLAIGAGPSWPEERGTLAPGDVVLFATDGFAEALSPAGDPLGYERAATLFANAAHRTTAGEIVDVLMSEAEAWRGTREQNDDIAMVVVRVRPSQD